MLFLKYSCFREAANQKKAGLKETLVEFKLKNGTENSHNRSSLNRITQHRLN